MKINELFEGYEPRYITDNNDQNPDQHEKDKTYAIKLVKFIQEHCQPWLSQTNNGEGYVYRGTKSVVREPNELAFIKNVRPDRKPKDSTPEQNEMFNDIMYKRIKAESQGYVGFYDKKQRIGLGGNWNVFIQ